MSPIPRRWFLDPIEPRVHLLELLQVRELGEELGWRAVDLDDAFADRRIADHRSAPGDIYHFDAAGHRRIAEQLHEPLLGMLQDVQRRPRGGEDRLGSEGGS